MCFGWFSNPADKAFKKGNRFYEKYKESQQTEDLTKAITHYKECLDLRLEAKKTLVAGQEPPEFRKKMADIYLHYSVAVLEKYSKQPTNEDLKLLTRLGPNLIENSAVPYPAIYVPVLYNFGITFFRGYRQVLESLGKDAASGEEDLKKLYYSLAFTMYNKLLELKDGTSGMTVQMRRTVLMDQGKMLIHSYNYSKSAEQLNAGALNQAVECFEQALRRFAAEDPNQRELRDCLENLATGYYIRYQDQGIKGENDLDKSIAHYRASRENFTAQERTDNRAWILCSHKLATALYKRYESSQKIVNRKYLDANTLDPGRGGAEYLREAKTVETEVMNTFNSLGGKWTADQGLSTTKREVEELLKVIDDHSAAISLRTQPSSRVPSATPSRNPSPAPSANRSVRE